MDKTTKALRARLRDILLRWVEGDVRLYWETMDESLDPHRSKAGNELLARLKAIGAGFDSNGLARVFLARLADDDEIGVIVSQIGERRPLKRVADEAPESGVLAPEAWVVSRPGLGNPSMPQDIKNMDTLLVLMAEAIVPEWIEHLADDAPDLDGLTPDARAVLLAMYELGAFCKEAKVTQTMIFEKVAELGEEIPKTRGGNAITLLRHYGYVDTKASTATWLTTRGQKAAESLKSSTNP
jgi:hypothetical protein